MKKNQTFFIPSYFPVMVGFEESGKWYAIDCIKGKLKIGNNEDDIIKQISFLELARLIASNEFCYIYPENEKANQICSILCNKDQLLETVLDFRTNAYCVYNDRIYQFSSNGIYSDGKRLSTDELPDSLYVIDPQMIIKNKEYK